MKTISVLCLLMLCYPSLIERGESNVQGSSTSKSISCGPPTYCARTDRRIQPYPRTPPTLGPAGSIISDPDFGSRILRVTDPKSDPQGKGRSMFTPSSAEANSWNKDSTRFYLLTPGGQFVLYAFDPSTMKIRQDKVVNAPWQGEPEFSYTRSNILYGVRRDNPAIQEYNAADGAITRVSLVSDCLKLPASVYGHAVSVSGDDQRMSTMLGPGQDRNPLVYVFDRKLGCRWLNIQTGEVGGQWGPKGTISTSDHCTMHNLRLSKSGEYVWIVCGTNISGNGRLVWEIATMNVRPCAIDCLGHHALGFSHLVGPSGRTHPMELVMRPLSRLDTTTLLVPGLSPTSGVRFWYDQHYSWNNANPGDTVPFCMSTYSGSNPSTPGAPLDTVDAWENEILCVSTDEKNPRVWRFAHTYSTAKGGFWSTPRGNVSQDGRFFMFTSDWENQLSESRGNSGEHRLDVFVVELR